MSTKAFETASPSGSEAVRPLRKKTLEGALYTRVPTVQSKLVEVLALPPDELVSRCAVRDRQDLAYVPSECLLYIVRTRPPDDDHFETLYKLLIERILRKTPTGESADGTKLSLPMGRLCEELLNRFVDLLAKDRTSYAEELDYLEVRFDGALANMRRDLQRKLCREPKGFSSIDPDPATGETDPEIEKAVSFDPFDPAEMEREDYRSRLNGAINSLPNEQKTILEMIGKKIPIDSKDPSAVTIAKTLGKSEKTIRSHRDQAFLAVKAMLERGKAI